MAHNWMAPWLSLFPDAGGAASGAGEASQWARFFPPPPEVNGKGDPELEAKIVRDVATYGAQLGEIGEIVLALAEQRPVPRDALEKLQAIMASVEAMKKTYTENTLARARAALDDLKERDRAGYDLLVASLDRERKG